LCKDQSSKSQKGKVDGLLSVHAARGLVKECHREDYSKIKRIKQSCNETSVSGALPSNRRRKVEVLNDVGVFAEGTSGSLAWTWGTRNCSNDYQERAQALLSKLWFQFLHNYTENVGLGDDANEHFVLNDGQPAYFVLQHGLSGFANRRRGRDNNWIARHDVLDG
jgi:hypothetical protein